MGNSQEDIIGGVRKKSVEHHRLCFLKYSKDCFYIFWENLGKVTAAYSILQWHYNEFNFRGLFLYIKARKWYFAKR